MTSALGKVKKYEISTERDIYWLGEVVRGTLKLSTSQRIECRGVRLEFGGDSFIHWHTGSGDDRNDYYGRKKYFSHRQTCYGNFYRTLLKDGCGENCIFGETAGDGDLTIPLNTAAMPLGTFKIIVRAMDYDWGKKDDLLGEIVLDPVQQLLQAPGQPFSFPLTRKGKPGKGEVTLSAYIQDNSQQVQEAAKGQFVNAATSGMQTLMLKCHQTTGLRSADWFGKNDVYVQAYIVGADTSPDKALPEPIKNTELPAGDLIIPFSFQIPWNGDYPSSLESHMGDNCYVRYSIYSNIDISWKLDPSTRHFVTVLNPTLAPPNLLVPAVRPIQPDKTMYACCCCCSKGAVNMVAMLDRQSASSGDNMFVTANVKNATSESVSFEVSEYMMYETRTRLPLC